MELQSNLSLSLHFCIRVAFYSKLFGLYYRYRTELSVYDNDDKTSFVLLGDAGPELTGTQARI